MDSGERGMNPVTLTVINPRKEYWPSRGSNQRLLVLKSCTLPTDSAMGLGTLYLKVGQTIFPEKFLFIRNVQHPDFIGHQIRLMPFNLQPIKCFILLIVYENVFLSAKYRYHSVHRSSMVCIVIAAFPSQATHVQIISVKLFMK